MISNPQEIRTSNRRKDLKKVYASKEWKKNVKEFVAGKECAWCGSKEHLLAHHPHIESYGDGTYTSLYLSGCMVLCNRCHFALHKGLVLCKTCRTRYHIVGADECRTCWLNRHPEILEAREKKKQELKDQKKKMRDDSKLRHCTSQLKKLTCKVEYPSKYHCKDCEFLGGLKRK